MSWGGHRRRLILPSAILATPLLVGWLLNWPAAPMAVIAMVATIAIGLIARLPDRVPVDPAAHAASSARVALFLADRGGVVVWANPASAGLVDVGDRWADAMRPVDGSRQTPPWSGEVVLPGAHVGAPGRTFLLTLDARGDHVAGTIEDMAEVVTLREALAQASEEATLRSRHGGDVALHLDREGRTRQPSAALGRLAGSSRPVRGGTALASLFEESEQPRVSQMIEAAGADGIPRLLTARLGSLTREIWVDVEIRPTDVDDTDRSGLVVALRDVSERRSAEAELERHEQLLKTVTRSSPVGIFALEGAVWTFVNDRLSEITGLTREELLDGGLWAHIHPEDRVQLDLGPTTGDDPAVADENGEPRIGGYYRLQRSDSEERWIHLRMSPVRDSAGHGWVGSVEDTTNEVTARQHTTLLATVVAGTTDLVAILNPDGVIRFLNPAGRELVGLDRASDTEPLHVSRLFGHLGWQQLSATALPVATVRGAWSGEAEVMRADGTTHPVSLVIVAHRDAVGRIDRLSMLARDTTGQKAVERRLARAAAHDPLTGLPNRAHFNDTLRSVLATAEAEEAPVALLFCDLDGFKAVNDRHGHAAGDQLLREVAVRLTHILRAGDIAGRVGGDEFLVLATSIEGAADAVALAERVRETLIRPIELGGDGVEVSVSFSIGVALSQRDDTPQELIIRADQAMYRAKTLGKNRVHAETGHAGGQNGPAIASDALRIAIEGDELELVYQPILDLGTGEISACEALVRWRHPELGLLPPARFIELAESSGLIRSLGAWVVREAARQATVWAADPSMPSGLMVSINLSQQQLSDGGLVAQATEVLRHGGLAPSCLCVELTERALVAGQDGRTLDELRALRELGVLVALDDYGTGLSSLAQLKHLPVDILKLDPRFVAGVGVSVADEAIVSTIQRLADSLSLTTIAEGVETMVQITTLQAMGCGRAQGFLISEPVPPDHFAGMVRVGDLIA